MARQRRPAGDGSFFKRSDGRWEGRVPAGIKDGKPAYKRVIRTDRKNAYAAWQELKRQQAAGVNLAAKRQTVTQFLAHWLRDVVPHGRSPNTVAQYTGSVRRMNGIIGHVPLDALTPQHVQGMLADELRAGYSATTVKLDRAILGMALDVAHAWGLVARNVAKATKAIKPDAYQPRVLTVDEARRLFEATKHDRLHALWKVAFGLALRRGEALGLRWHDINLEHGILKTVGNLQYVDGKLIIRHPKSSESIRTLPIPPSLIATLRQHRTRQANERLMVGSDYQDHGLVFCRQDGRPFYPTNILPKLHAALKTAGLPPMRFHDLRHSCATILLASGEPVKVVQEILGHADPVITLKIYQHVRTEERHEALKRMDVLFEETA